MSVCLCAQVQMVIPRLSCCRVWSMNIGFRLVGNERKYRVSSPDPVLMNESRTLYFSGRPTFSELGGVIGNPTLNRSMTPGKKKWQDSMMETFHRLRVIHMKKIHALFFESLVFRFFFFNSSSCVLIWSTFLGEHFIYLFSSLSCVVCELQRG